jgi:hypothetical protein
MRVASTPLCASIGSVEALVKLRIELGAARMLAEDARCRVQTVFGAGLL